LSHGAFYLFGNRYKHIFN